METAVTDTQGAPAPVISLAEANDIPDIYLRAVAGGSALFC
jgi:hypothetical protein